eukprot:8618937-Ditylum_brightwellii.AAC.1
MQNIQHLKGSGGCNKYCNKYVAKVDKQSYVVVEIEGQAQLVTKSFFLRNTKITSSKIAEDKKCKNHIGKVQELRAGISVIGNGRNEEANVEDAAFVHSAVDNERNLSGLPMWRRHTAKQLLIIDDLKLSKMSVDKII